MSTSRADLLRWLALRRRDHPRGGGQAPLPAADAALRLSSEAVEQETLLWRFI